MPDLTNSDNNKQSRKTDGLAVSLIIPCYNIPEEHITRALTSAKMQSIADYEIILVDDGSNEGYGEVLTRLCGSEKNTTLIRTGNRGASAARNTGALAARGEYVAFLDADDLLAADFLERAWAAVVETHADFVIGGLTLIDQPDQFHVSSRVNPLPYCLYAGNAVRELYPHLIGQRFRICFPDGHIGRGPVSRLIRTELMRKCLFDETLRIGEDVVWNLQLLSLCSTVCVVHESWYGYWRNPDSVTRRYSSAFVEECRKGLAKIPPLIDYSDDQAYSSYTDRIYELMRRCWVLYLRKARIGDRKAYRRAIKSLYTQAPWTELGSLRYMTTGGRYRKDMLLFRLHLYFAVVARRERRAGK